ncbi:MAG: hypothetical protein AAGK14_10840 [Verrucomicrobiota bacterium]
MVSDRELAAYEARSQLGVDFLRGVLGAGAPLPSAPCDLTLFAKPACLFASAGCLLEANRLLDQLAAQHLQPDGDFLSGEGAKAIEVDYLNHFWSYPNGWIALAAHKLGRFDLSYPAYRFMHGLVDAETGAVFNLPEGREPRYLDLVSTAHTGHVALYLGDVACARRACGALQMFFENQPERERRFYLRFHADGSPVTEFSDEDRPFFVLNTSAPDHFYFMLGYPLALLSLFHRATGGEPELANARRYFELLATCPGVARQHFSHKVAWGAAVYHRASGDTEAATLAQSILDFLVEQQDDQGRFFADQPPATCWDQTAEAAFWLRTAAAELRG